MKQNKTNKLVVFIHPDIMPSQALLNLSSMGLVEIDWCKKESDHFKGLKEALEIIPEKLLNKAGFYRKGTSPSKNLRVLH